MDKFEADLSKMVSLAKRLLAKETITTGDYKEVWNTLVEVSSADEPSRVDDLEANKPLLGKVPWQTRKWFADLRAIAHSPDATDLDIARLGAAWQGQTFMSMEDSAPIQDEEEEDTAPKKTVPKKTVPKKAVPKKAAPKQAGNGKQSITPATAMATPEMVSRLADDIVIAQARENIRNLKEIEDVIDEEIDRYITECTPGPQQPQNAIKQTIEDIVASDDPNQIEELIGQLDPEIKLVAQASLSAVGAKIRDVKHKNQQLFDALDTLETLVNGSRPLDDEDDHEDNGDEDTGDQDQDHDDEDENSGGEGNEGNEE